MGWDPIRFIIKLQFFGNYGTWNFFSSIEDSQIEARCFFSRFLGTGFKDFYGFLLMFTVLLLLFYGFLWIFGRSSCQTFFCLKSITHSEKSARLRAENDGIHIECEPKIIYWFILLMEEILHRLGCIKPCKHCDKLPINWCRICSINRITYFLYALRDMFCAKHLLHPTK